MINASQSNPKLEENPPIKLNSEDSLAFAESLLNPPEPNQRAIAAAAEYKQSMKELTIPSPKEKNTVRSS